MKFNIEDYLQKLDATFKDKSKKDIYMIYIMTFAIIFSISYIFFWDNSFKSFTVNKNRISFINSKIDIDNIYLSNNPINKIKALDKKIKTSKLQLITDKDNNTYIKHQIESISQLIYNERTWGEYLHSISINAQKYHVT